jgi:hypothetical protein
MNLSKTIDLTARLTDARDTCARFFGDEWPAKRKPWQDVITAKAAQENKGALLAAMELAKDAPNGMVKLVILAAAVDLPSA